MTHDVRTRGARIAGGLQRWLGPLWWVLVLFALLAFAVIREGKIWGVW